MFHSNIKNLSQLKPAHIESYQRERLRSVELKRAADGVRPGIHKKKKLPQPQTVNYEVSVLRSAFIWARDRELISTVPTKKVRKLKPTPTKSGKILSQEQCAQLLRAVREMAESDQRMEVYWKAFVFLLNTGLRSGELCYLTWDDVDLKTGLIRIRPKDDWTPKTYAREFFLNQACVDLLEGISHRKGYIFVRASGEQC